MLWSEIGNRYSDKVVVVGQEPVWDYKADFDKQELRLIHEPVGNISPEDHVTLKEISEYLGLFQDLQVVSETDGTLIDENRLHVLVE